MINWPRFYDFSLVQYLGTEPNPTGDVRQARFTYNGAALGYYEYARVAVSGGKADFNPLYELQATMRTLCNDLEDRRQAVDQAVQAGLSARNHPTTIPANIYLSDDGDWESYATPARDARLRAAFVQFRRDLGQMIQLWIWPWLLLFYQVMKTLQSLNIIVLQEKLA